MSDEEKAAAIHFWAEMNGWGVFGASFYDEEGVDGWIWEDPDGNQYTELGDHTEPPAIPEGVRELWEREMAAK